MISVDTAEAVGLVAGRDTLPGRIGLPHEARVSPPETLVGFQPVARIVASGVSLEFRIAPFRQLLAQTHLGEADALGTRKIGIATAEHEFGLVIQGAQELALPPPSRHPGRQRKYRQR